MTIGEIPLWWVLIGVPLFLIVRNFCAWKDQADKIERETQAQLREMDRWRREQG